MTRHPRNAVLLGSGLVSALLLTTPFGGRGQELMVAQRGNAGVVLSDGATTLLVDLPHVPGAHGYASYDSASLEAPGAVVAVITHEHADHFDAATLARRPTWRVVGPPEVVLAVAADQALEGDSVSVGDFTIVSVTTPHTAGHRSYRISWLGREIHVAGDTGDPTTVPRDRVDLLFLTPWLACRLQEAGRSTRAERVFLYHLRPDGGDRDCGLGERALPEGLVLRPHPEFASREARLVTADVERFFEAVRKAEGSDDPVGVLKREYLEAGSPGLRYYHESGRLESAERLWRTWRRYPQLYDVVASFYEDTQGSRAALEAPYRYFERLVPDAETPPVYLVIGHFQGGATLFDGGLVVALDNWAADWGGFEDLTRDFTPFDPVEVLQPVIAHELTHFHQRCWEECGSLLGEVVMEGSADFIASLVVGVETNYFFRDMYAYYRRHEADLWARFHRDRSGAELSPWLYDNDVEPLPANLGYAIGHAVARSYWERMGRTDRALREILAVDDYESFLESSGYAPQEMIRPGDVVVANLGDHSLSVLDGENGELRARITEPEDLLRSPTGVAYGPDGDLYVASSGSDRILRYDGGSGAYLGIFAAGPPLVRPFSLIFAPDSTLLVASGSSVLRYHADGRALGVAASGMEQPIGLAVGPDGILHVANSTEGRVDRFDPVSGSYRGPATETPVPFASDVTIGPDGSLYVSSASRRRVLRFPVGSRAGRIVAELPSDAVPMGLAFREGRLLIGDFQGGRVFLLDPDRPDDLDVLADGGLRRPENLAVRPRPGPASGREGPSLSGWS